MTALKATLARLLGLAAFAVLLSPPTAGAQAPRGDSVTGTGTVETPGSQVTLTVDARSGPTGENASGSFVLRPVAYSGPVTCLNVAGNRAVVGVEFDVNPGGPRVGSYFVIEDNGPVADTVAGTSFLDLPLAGCPLEPTVPLTGPFALASGDFVVRDVPPVPTSAEQCKRGGYVRFGFKSQGPCVAFVQRGPKP